MKNKNGRKEDEKKELRKWKNKCLKLWSQIVRERAGNKCEFCGSTKYLNSHHIVGKKFKPLRFEILNGICLYANCHKWKIGLSAHENPILVAEWLKKNRPDAYKFLATYDYSLEILDTLAYYKNMYSILEKLCK